MKSSKFRIFTWSLYDFANTIFSLNVVSLYFPIMIKSVYKGPDLALSVARSASMLMVAISMPLAGVAADRLRRRMPFTIFFTLVCCLATFLLGKHELMLMQLVLFAIAIYCYQAALVFYDAVLPQLTSPQQMGRVSGYGVALGYMGSIFSLAVIPLFARSTDYSQIFTWTAALFLVFAVPFFLTVRDQSPLPVQRIWKLAFESAKRISVILRDAKSSPGLLRLFVARFFIVEALETIIFFMGTFLYEAAGFSNVRTIVGNFDEIRVYFLVVTIFTAAGSLAWGFVTDRLGPRNSLIGAVVLWVVTLASLIFTANKGVYYVLGSLAGISLGGVWTTERPLLINLVSNNERLAEYFGFFALTGRMAAVIGPIIWGVTVWIFGPLGTIKYRFAVGSVLLMMITGLVILRKVPDAR